MVKPNAVSSVYQRHKTGNCPYFSEIIFIYRRDSTDLWPSSRLGLPGHLQKYSELDRSAPRIDSDCRSTESCAQY